MVQTGTENRARERRRATATAFGVVVALGVVGIVAGGPSERAFAFQAPEGRQSVLGPASAPSGEMPKPGSSSEAADASKQTDPAPKSAPGTSEAVKAEKRPKLTQQDARELTQALRQLQAAVQADREKAAAVEVKLQRPTRSVTPPTLTSAELDRLVDRFLAKNDPKVEIAPTTTDVEFVRRVYFDLIGKPPTPEQFTAFVRDRNHDKRARLIDSLLNNKEWAQNWARYWRDVVKFHSTNENPNRVRFDSMEDWLAEQFQANKPWDEIAARLITATGRNDEYGAVSFPMAYEGQPVEMAGEVSRIFMGVQIQCAQCHDHKTDSWKRQQFHEFAAFFAGTRAQLVVQGGPGQLPVFSIVAQPRARYTMPDKDNPTRQIPIAPRFFLSSSGSKHAEPSLPMNLGPEQRRELVASYITGQDNPWFARAFINRIWYTLMGEAFYDPIDDIGPERTPRAPEVLEPLATQWQRGGYDIRWLFRTLLNTQAYQRRARSTATAAGKTPFASGCPSRMRADQMFDALVQALAIPLDAEGNLMPQGPNNKARAQAQAKNAQVSLGDPKRAQANNAAQAKPKPGATKKAIQAAGLPLPAVKNVAAMVRRGGPRLAFERLFGVDPSIANDDILGTIPQALFLMNGQLVHSRITARPGTVLGEILASAPNDLATLNALYLRALSRHPTTKEVEICGRYLANVGDRREAFEDIYWSLINSTEFVTRALKAQQHESLYTETRPIAMNTERELVQVAMNGEGVIGRRHFLRTIGLGAAGAAASGAISLSFTDCMALHAADMRKRQMACILLWMAGGPSQFETFDPKPGTDHGGETRSIATSVPGIAIAEGWQHTAKVMNEIALVRSMTNKEGNHQRATYQLHTGYVPSATIKHPNIGCSLASELAESHFDLPHMVSIGGATIGAGFLGAAMEPFVVQNPEKPPDNTQPKVPTDRFRRRLGLLDRLEGAGFERVGGLDRVRDHRALYTQTAKMILSPHMRAFGLEEESAPIRDAYGRTAFGQGCLLARRLVQAGVTFVEVRSNGWDTHQQSHDRVGKLATQVDPAFAALIADLKRNGMLDKTLVVWMGEFGRTPKINPNAGRDHFPKVFNLALAGGGVKGGQVIGASNADGTDVKDRPVGVPDLLASLCHALKVDPHKEAMTPVGRPIKVVDGGKAVRELFG